MGQNNIEMKCSKLTLYSKWISKHLIKSGQYLNHFISAENIAIAELSLNAS